MRDKYLLHPFLFSLAPLFMLFSHNQHELPLQLLINPVLLIGSLSLGLSVLVWRVSKNIQKGGILLSVGIILFFSYGHVMPLFENFIIPLPGTDGIIGPTKVVLFLFGVLFLFIAYFVVKTRLPLQGFTTFLNTMSGALILMPLIQISFAEASQSHNKFHFSPITTDGVLEGDNSSATIGSRRDIYYLIFDRYGRKDFLQELFNFDNSSFENYLEGKGFTIASQSFANYPKTFLSLGSSLNLNYLDAFAASVGTDSPDKKPGFQLLKDYSVWRILKSQGYTFIHLGSWWPPTQQNPFADFNYNSTSALFNPLSLELLKLTPLHDLIQRFAPLVLKKEDASLYQFHKLMDDIQKIQSPKFIFAHILLPHPPFVFRPDGTRLSHEEQVQKGEAEKYLAQLQFTNTQIQQVIDKILSSSSLQPIIIVQSDEGPFAGVPEIQGKKIKANPDWAYLKDIYPIKAHLAILNAYLLPGLPKEVIYPTITPVNSFRIIFNHYFGMNLPLLPDKSYIYLDKDHPYNFIEVTDKINLKKEFEGTGKFRRKGLLSEPPCDRGL